MFEEFFLKKRIVTKQLLKYGFVCAKDTYVYICDIMDGEFSLRISFDNNGNVDTALYDKDTEEEYILYKTESQGVFVGMVRYEISKILSDVSERCFVSSSFRGEQTLSLVSYAQALYKSNPEFLWESTPSNGILRREDSGKWYAAILTIPKNKLGFQSSQSVEIVNMHATPDTVRELLRKDGFYPAWHMNKKSWYTVILDGSVDDTVLHALLSDSYRLAGKEK